MNKIINLSIAIFLLFFLACQSSDPNHLAEEALKDEVMVIHDEVMPKTGEMTKLRKNLQNFLNQDSIIDPTTKATVLEAITYLEKADEGMYDWMAEFKKPKKLRGEKSHEEIMAYLKEEKVKIEQVKYDMLTSIKTAVEILEKNGQN